MAPLSTAPPVVARDTASQILDVAERLVQTRGFNDFSYADVATELGVSKPSLHYHFASKAALGDALIARYSTRFLAELDRIEAQSSDPRTRLEGYAELYGAVLAAGRMCLCGMLAAEYQTLPPTMRAAVLEFFERNEAWLERVLADSRPTTRALNPESTRDAARMIIDTLEGAVMISRAQNDVDRFARVAARLIITTIG